MNNLSRDRQKEIYLNGFAGTLPSVPASFNELENRAKHKLSSQAYAYIAGGAGNESTLRNNTQSFEKYKIVPRMLRDVSVRDSSIELFGQKIPSPMLLAPIGVLQLAHRQADLGVAKAAAALNIPYVFSNQASYAMEEVASVMDNNPRWFQLYWSKSNELVKSFVHRAERCGCTAIVVTLDTTMLGWRTRDLDMAYLPFLEGKGIAQYTSDSVFQKLMDVGRFVGTQTSGTVGTQTSGTQTSGMQDSTTQTSESSAQISTHKPGSVSHKPGSVSSQTHGETKRKITWQSISGLIEMTRNYPGNNFISKLKSGRQIKAVQEFVNIYSNPALTWNDLKFLKEITKLPIVLKGILHADDARKAIDFGMDGIIVSNHGGRQVDGSISTIDALPSIVAAVQNRVPVLMDSGIRGGADIFKALALGAKAVLIGRPYVYGLAIAGEQGVKEVLQNLLTDFELTMGLSGCKSVAEISTENLRS